MATITFKTKPIKVYNADDSFAFTQINVPNFTRAHIDMAEMRNHPKYRSYANSDLFPSILKGIKRQHFPMGWFKLEEAPEGITVDATGFLAIVTFEV